MLVALWFGWSLTWLAPYLRPDPQWEIQLSRLLSRTARTCVVVIVAAGGLAACSNGNKSGDETASDTTATTAESGSNKKPDGDESAGDPEKNGAAQAGIDLDDPPEPIGEVMVPVNKDGITQTKVEVLEAKKRGKVLLVTFRITPEGTTSESVRIFDAMGKITFSPELIDLKNLKSYGHVGKLTVDDIAAGVEIGESLYGYTAFPLPPDDLKTIDMRVNDLAPPIEDLPLP